MASGESTYTWAGDAQRMAGELVHEHHRHLALTRIAWVFKAASDKASLTQPLVKVSAVNPLTRFLVEDAGDGHAPAFVVVLAARRWTWLSQAQQRALVDHALSFLQEDDDGVVAIGKPDVSEFVGVLARHGAWWPDATAYLRVSRQLALADVDPATGEVRQSEAVPA